MRIHTLANDARLATTASPTTNNQRTWQLDMDISVTGAHHDPIKPWSRSKRSRP